MPRDAHGRLALALGLAFLAAQAWIVVLPGLSVPPGHAYLGFPHLPTDHAQYQMVAAQAREGGGPFYRNLYTTEPQDGRFLMLGLTATGWFQRLVPLPDATAWHLLRLGAAGLLALVLWRLCATVLGRGPRALAAFAAMLFTGGLDWVVAGAAAAGATGVPGAASWASNPWNFSVFWSSAIATWAWPLLVVSALLAWEAARPAPPPGPPAAGSRLRPGWTRSLVRGLSVALLWTIHPYSAIAWGLLVALASAVPAPGPAPWPRRLADRLLDSLPALAGPALVVAYSLWAREDPAFAAASEQVSRWRLSYPPHLWPLAFGPQVLLALAGLGRDRPGERGFAWIQAWLAVVLLLSVNPVVTGAKFPFLAPVPLVLLEARGAFRLWDRYRASRPGALPRAVPVLATVAALVLCGSTVHGLVRDGRDDANRRAAQVDADRLQLLGALRDLPAGGVLCAPGSGLLVPWMSGKPVFTGHWFLSTRYYEKADLVRWFFAGPATDGQRAGFLRAAGIRWVLHGPEEAALGPVPEVPGLVRAWSGGPGSIWEWSGP